MADLKELLGLSLDTLLDNLGDVGSKYIDLEKIIPAVNDLLVDQASEIRQLNKELAGGSRTAAAFKGAMADVARQTGISINKQYDLLNVTNKYHQGIIDTTKSTLNFIKASGASVKSTGELSAKLTILGNVSEESFNSMYEGILAVRNQLGLTAEQIDEVLELTTKYAVVTQATEAQLNSASMSIAKFTSQLTKAGLEASDVSNILNSIIDPDKMMDNITLLSKIGLSASDLMSGYPLQDIDYATEKLRQLGVEIANIAKTNRFQANEVAKVYGLTLEQAIHLSKLETDQGAIDAKKSLDDYKNEMMTFTDSIKSFTTVLTGLFAGPLSLFGDILQKFTDTIGFMPRTLLAVFAGVKIKRIAEILLDKLGEGAKKFVGEGAKKFGKNVADSYYEQVQKHSMFKAGDIAALTPKADRVEKLDYGKAGNFAVRARERRDEYNRNYKDITRRKISDGEIIEMLQESLNRIAEVKKYGSTIINEEEKSIYGHTYGTPIELLEKEYSDIIKSLDEDTEKWKTFISGTPETLKGNLDYFKIVPEQLGITDKNKEAFVEMSKLSSGPREFIKNTIEFWKNSNDKNASKNIENATKALEQFDNAMLGTAEKTEKAKQLIEKSNEILDPDIAKKELKGKFGYIIQGIGINISTMFGKIVGNIGKVLKFSGISVLLGTVGLISKSLHKNEKYQEARQQIQEKLSTIFDGIVSKIEPNIEQISNAITGFLDIIQPAIEIIANIVGKISNWLGKTLNGYVSSIDNKVSTIEDSYKKEDLKDMMLATTVGYDKTNDALIAKIDDLIYVASGISKKQDEANETQLTTMYATQQG